jgi:hypothetical protein
LLGAEFPFLVFIEEKVKHTNQYRLHSFYRLFKNQSPEIKQFILELIISVIIFLKQFEMFLHFIRWLSRVF